MACKNCNYSTGLAKKKLVKVEGIVNDVLSVYCVKCGNLMYGHCKPVKT